MSCSCWLRTALGAVAVAVAGLRQLPLHAADQAAPVQGRATVHLIEENDLLWDPVGDHSDRHYTQGLKLVVLGATDQFTNLTAGLNRVIPALGIQRPELALGFALGQNIYTPEDYSLATPDPRDRPYAGWLYGELIFQRREPALGASWVTMDTVTLALGVVGPEALGEQAQNTIHRLRSFPLAQGWDAQLETEPAIQLKYDRRWRLTWNDATGSVVDLVPHLAANLGNVQVSAEAGAMLRLGWNLPDNFGVVRIDSAASPVGSTPRDGRPWSVYLYGEAIGRAVAHNLFLDGNSFRGGPGVNREPLVADLCWGLAVKVGRHLELGYGWVVRTEEFSTQRGVDKLGTVSLRATF